MTVKRMRGTTALACGVTLSLFACGNVETQNLRQNTATPTAQDATHHPPTGPNTIDESNVDQVHIGQDIDGDVQQTVVVTVGSGGLSLTGQQAVTWSTELEERYDVETSIAEQQYLKVSGSLDIPSEAANKHYKLGCLNIELVDNVLYADETMLRIATTGIHGNKFDVTLPLEVKRKGWQAVPELEDGLTIARFDADTIKKLNHRLCFRLDYREAPAQEYAGQIVIQYMVPGRAPPPDDTPECFHCATDPKVLAAGQEATLSWTGHKGKLHYSLAAADGSPGDFGTLTELEDGQVVYKAPSSIAEETKVLVIATPGEEALPAFCEITLMADDDLGVPDDGESQGLVGNVYQLAKNTKRLPDFASMEPVSRVIMPNLDVPVRDFRAGFPGVEELVEWFGVRFTGTLVVPEDCDCEFRLRSDDGAILSIDGQMVIDNDGTHAVRAKQNAISLVAGEYDIRVDYFQGPRYHIALQLEWKRDGEWTIIPPEHFLRPSE